MKKTLFLSAIFLLAISSISAQTLQDARKMYVDGYYREALPVFQKELQKRPNDASLNHWYAVSLYMTGGELDVAEKSLLVAANRKVQESNLYLALIYTHWFDFEQAEKYLNAYNSHLTRKGWRSNAQKEEEIITLEKMEEARKDMLQLKRMVSHTEDIQIIDSIVVSKNSFLSAYSLSFNGGSLATFHEIFDANHTINSTVYINEKETKMYYAVPDTTGVYNIFTMEYLIDHYGNERKISSNRFDLEGSINYPFLMPDGLTIYFAGQDPESIGGYDLFVSRYNMNTDSYLKPERLNMPFNSTANDYMMVIDEGKGIGWFASDRGMPDDKVCVYTFIPNKVVKIIQSQDNKYLANRARISSIKDTWPKEANFSKLITSAKEEIVKKEERHKDFEFVVNDNITYYTLQDFTNIKARDAYYNVVQKKSELAVINERLELEREKYMKSDRKEKNSLTFSIQDLEKRQRNIAKSLPKMETEARNIENMHQRGK